MFSTQAVNAVFFIAMHKSYGIDYIHKLYEKNFSLEKPHSNNFCADKAYSCIGITNTPYKFNSLCTSLHL